MNALKSNLGLGELGENGAQNNVGHSSGVQRRFDAQEGDEHVDDLSWLEVHVQNPQVERATSDTRAAVGDTVGRGGRVLSLFKRPANVPRPDPYHSKPKPAPAVAPPLTTQGELETSADAARALALKNTVDLSLQAHEGADAPATLRSLSEDDHSAIATAPVTRLALHHQMVAIPAIFNRYRHLYLAIGQIAGSPLAYENAKAIKSVFESSLEFFEGDPAIAVLINGISRRANVSAQEYNANERSEILGLCKSLMALLKDRMDKAVLPRLSAIEKSCATIGSALAAIQFNPHHGGSVEINYGSHHDQYLVLIKSTHGQVVIEGAELLEFFWQYQAVMEYIGKRRDDPQDIVALRFEEAKKTLAPVSEAFELEFNLFHASLKKLDQLVNPVREYIYQRGDILTLCDELRAHPRMKPYLFDGAKKTISRFDTNYFLDSRQLQNLIDQVTKIEAEFKPAIDQIMEPSQLVPLVNAFLAKIEKHDTNFSGPEKIFTRLLVAENSISTQWLYQRLRDVEGQLKPGAIAQLASIIKLTREKMK